MMKKEFTNNLDPEDCEIAEELALAYKLAEEVLHHHDITKTSIWS
jgi:hypothetical protein